MQTMVQTPTSPTVIVIPASMGTVQKDKLTVAAYCRVSSSSADQLNSYATQLRHYNQMAHAHPEWDFVDIYADEGISGLKAQNRPEFQRLMSDCRAGKVKRILVKTVSRFSRNNVDCLESLRELALLGVTVLFEEQNLDTALCKGEMLVSFLSTLAQKESLSISRNLKMGNRMRMKRGTFVPSSVPYGYRLVNRQLEVYEPEAQVVRSIFRMYLSGLNLVDIVRKLNDTAIPSPCQNRQWAFMSVRYILKNEMYTGDAIWQKTYTTDSLPLRKCLNNGCVDKFYAANHHSGIVSKEAYAQVQRLLAERGVFRKQIVQHEHPFRGTIRCGECNALLRKKSCGNKTYWVCRRHHSDLSACSQKQIPQTALESAFCTMYNKLRNNPVILDTMLSQLLILRSAQCSGNAELTECTQNILSISEQLHLHNRLYAEGLMDAALFLRQQDVLGAQLTKLRQKKTHLLTVDNENDAISATKSMIAALERGAPYLWAFDENAFRGLVTSMEAATHEVTFHLHNKLTLKERLT